MSVLPRVRILACFKKLHRTRRLVFDQDEPALVHFRGIINEQYREGKVETDPEKCDYLINQAEEAEEALRKLVLQYREVRPGVVKPTIHKDTYMMDNLEFDITLTDRLPKMNKKCTDFIPSPHDASSITQPPEYKPSGSWPKPEDNDSRS